MDSQNEELLKYKQEIKAKLEKLDPIFGKAAFGDFSHQIEFEEDDEFYDLYQGINILLETEQRRLKDLEQLNKSLEDKVAERTKQIEEKLDQLERFTRLLTDRELKMIELKKQITELEAKILDLEAQKM